MPWLETNAVEERLRFVLAVRGDGVSVAAACRRFGVSRPTGYKWLQRYDEGGVEALCDEIRAPGECPHRTPDDVVERLLEVRDSFDFGPRKIRAYLLAQRVSFRVPAPSTIGEILKKHGRVETRKKRKRVAPQSEPFGDCTRPNDTWTADFKGQFLMGNQRHCYPLTAADACSRFIVCCKGLHSTKYAGARAGFEAAFRRYGLPRRIRTDNGAPFASVGIAGLSRLSVWWLKLGIEHERIEPGHPEQNGRHERMHLTLKRAVTRPAEKDLRAQQHTLDAFVYMFNHERPHEALKMDVPAQHYEPSTTGFEPNPPDPVYTNHDLERRVYPSGQLQFAGSSLYIGTVLARELVGLRELEDDCWLVSFGDVDLGFFKEGDTKLRPIQKTGNHWRNGRTKPTRPNQNV